MNSFSVSQRKGRTPGFPLWLPPTLIQESLHLLVPAGNKKVTGCWMQRKQLFTVWWFKRFISISRIMVSKACHLALKIEDLGRKCVFQWILLISLVKIVLTAVVFTT